MFNRKLRRENAALRAEQAQLWLRATTAARRVADVAADEARVAHARQCEQLANDIITARRNAAEARAGAQRVHDQNRALRERLEQAREAQADADFTRLYERLTRALRACARYRGRIADQAVLLAAHARQLKAAETRTEQLQARLDDALGLNDPDVAAGADWQSRRTDKRRAA